MISRAVVFILTLSCVCLCDANEVDVPNRTKGHPNCVFPFSYKNVLYSKCTNKNWYGYWCSTTKTFNRGSYNWEWCTVISDANEVDVPNRIKGHPNCIFPFIYMNVLYSKCTMKKENAYWCSTTKTFNRGSDDFEWCTDANEEDVPDDIKGHPNCIFPFIYMNVLYSKCTKKDYHRYWCATVKDYTTGSGNFRSCKKETKIHPSSCKQYQEEQKENGIYKIRVGKNIMDVFCDVSDSNGDSWIVIQRRINGSVSFARTWIEYKNGFGDPNGEFWLGNDRLNELTSVGPMKIRFDLWDKDDNHTYAEYSSFYVASESENYRLYISGHSGPVRDGGKGMSRHNNLPFSTKDRDNDLWFDSCSVKGGGSGGWWFQHCHFVNLNGRYLIPGTRDYHGIRWHTFRGFRSLKKTIIKISYYQ